MRAVEPALIADQIPISRNEGPFLPNGPRYQLAFVP
jgi:hypothetical protein